MTDRHIPAFRSAMKPGEKKRHQAPRRSHFAMDMAEIIGSADDR